MNIESIEMSIESKDTFMMMHFYFILVIAKYNSQEQYKLKERKRQDPVYKHHFQSHCFYWFHWRGEGWTMGQDTNTTNPQNCIVKNTQKNPITSNIVNTA